MMVMLKVDDYGDEDDDHDDAHEELEINFGAQTASEWLARGIAVQLFPVPIMIIVTMFRLNPNTLSLLL